MRGHVFTSARQNATAGLFRFTDNSGKTVKLFFVFSPVCTPPPWGRWVVVRTRERWGRAIGAYHRRSTGTNA
jgi:hypothetical protein